MGLIAKADQVQMMMKADQTELTGTKKQLGRAGGQGRPQQPGSRQEGQVMVWHQQVTSPRVGAVGSQKKHILQSYS